MSDSEKKPGYDTRQILSQLREEYWHGVTDEEEVQPEGGQVQIMSFWLGDEYYAADATYCKSVIKFPKIIRVPRTPDFVEGVVNLRGQITSVIDLRKIFGLKLNPLDNPSRLLVIEVGEMATAMIVEKIGEIINRPLAEMQEPAAGATKMKAEFVKGYFEETFDGGKTIKLMIYLDLEKIFSASELKVDYRAKD